MSDEANRMDRLVNDLMSLNQVESQERSKPTTKIELTELIKETVEKFLPVCKKTNNSVVFENLNEKLQIEGDLDQLQQVISNLIENAMKYGGTEKEIKIKLHTPLFQPLLQKQGVVLDVSDQGEGIPEEYIPRLTERKIMDNRNVFVAIALSMSVLLFWGAFFETPKNNIENKTNKQIEKKDNSIQPSASQAPEINKLNIEKKISRNDSIKKSDRIKIENNNIIGSISLEGGLIDDISFKNHKQKVDGDKNIEFLNPAQTENGFYVESGWASVGNEVKVPTKSSKWQVEGNKVLTNTSPVKLKWDNQEGVTFKKKIELDDKYLIISDCTDSLSSIKTSGSILNSLSLIKLSLSF